MRSLNSEIKYRLSRTGASLVGFADISNLPEETRESMPCAVVIAVALKASVISGIRDGPTREYFEEYKRVNSLLLKLANDMAGFIRQRGFKAMVLKPTPEKLPENLATALPHKTAATLAGLGWVGKSNLLITERFGSAVRLVSVFTDAPLEAGKPIEGSRCGDCDKCVVHCPAGALLGEKWQAGIERGKIVDVYVCRDTAVRLCKDTGLDATICGVCINVCPWTQKYISHKKTD